MDIYLAIKYHPNAENRRLIESITDILAAHEHTVTCVVRDIEEWGTVTLSPDALMRAAFQVIDRADLVLVELSEKGVGLGIEAGYAHAQGMPIVVIARTGSPISATLRGIATAVVYYEKVADLATLPLPSAPDRFPSSAWPYAARSVDRLLACLDGLDTDALNWSPLPTGNSLYILATHIIGNIEETVWGVVCGENVQRNREAEFQASGSDPALLLAHWQELREKIDQALAAMSSAELAQLRVHPRRGPMSGHEILVIVARHAAEHLAQAEMTRDLLANQLH